MLHTADQNLVSWFQAWSQPVGNQIDSFRGAAGPDDLSGASGVQKMTNGFPCAIKGCSCPITKCVSTAMHIGVHLPVIPIHCIQYGDGLLSRGTIVQIDQWLSFDL